MNKKNYFNEIIKSRKFFENYIIKVNKIASPGKIINFNYIRYLELNKSKIGVLELLQSKIKKLDPVDPKKVESISFLHLESTEETFDLLAILMKQFHPIAFLHFIYNVNNDITIPQDISSRILKLFRQKGFFLAL